MRGYREGFEWRFAGGPMVARLEYYEFYEPPLTCVKYDD